MPAIDLDRGVVSRMFFEDPASQGIMISMYKGVPGEFYWPNGTVVDLDAPIRPDGPLGKKAVEGAGFKLKDLLLERRLNEAKIASTAKLHQAMAERREAIEKAAASGNAAEVEKLIEAPLQMPKDETPAAGASGGSVKRRA